MTPSELACLFIRKGVQDEDAVSALLENRDIADEIVGFHCQQAAEKYMKAVLVSRKIEFRKTHDLEELLQLIEDNGIGKPEKSEDLGELEPFAVAFRYDFLDEPSLFDRRKALEIVRRVRAWAEIQISK
ncbi:MAG: HEPN domain-containing protein [Victivallales bacterium]|jgi:HEPN domain-containing protein